MVDTNPSAPEGRSAVRRLLSPRAWFELRNERRRQAYRGGRPRGFARLEGKIAGVLFARGVLPDRAVELEVTGRRTGRPLRLPLVLSHYRGERYLASMLGEDVNWVRNVRAAEGRAVLRHGRTEPVRLEEVPVAERAPILKQYLHDAPGARPHVPIDRHQPVADFEAIAADYPVFRVVSV